MNKQKRSIERTPLSGGAPKKKSKSNSTRRSSTNLENSGNQSEDQGYCSDIKLTQHSQTLNGIDNVKDDMLHSSNDSTAFVDAIRMRSRLDIMTIDPTSARILLHRVQDN
jgi:hypothetical protein